MSKGTIPVILWVWIILTIPLFATPTLRSSENNHIYEIEFGSCWLEQTSDEHWKVASFLENVAFKLSVPRISEQINEELREYLENIGITKFFAGDYEFYFYCGPANKQFIINLQTVGASLCIKARFDLSESQLFISKVLSHHGQKSGPCFGHGPRVILLYLNTKFNDYKVLVEYLQSNTFKGKIENVYLDDEGTPYISLFLTEKYNFVEDKVMKDLKRDNILKKDVKSFVYNYELQLVGSFEKIFLGHFSGF